MNIKTIAAIAVSSLGFSSAWAIDAPGGLVVNVTKFDSVDLSWSAVDGASSYYVTSEMSHRDYAILAREPGKMLLKRR